MAFGLPESHYRPFTDATTYLAAGERLNAGHELYAMSPGDLAVALEPQLSSSPLFSPPPIAVLWRPLAAIPFGLALWIAAAWAAFLGAMAYVGLRCGWVGVALAIAAIRPAGELLAVGNVSLFFPALFIVAWRWRARPAAGGMVAAAAAIKLAPGAMLGWLIAERRARPLIGVAIVAVAIAVVTILGAGVDSIRQYVAISGQIKPSETSLSVLSGIPWLSTAVLVLGAIAAAALYRRPRLSFAVAVTAATIGTPALYLAGLAPLLAIAAPFEEPR